MSVRRFILMLWLMFPFGRAYSLDYIWIVGGGPSAQNSQGQIELNVKWEREVILRQAHKARLKIFYTDGDKSESDVLVWQRPIESAATLQPLARVFDAQVRNGERFHSHTVPGVEGNTRVSELTDRLRKGFSQASPGDRVLFIFYGHGTYDDKDVSGNALRLWGNTLLPARELETLLSTVNPAVPVRFVLPQCFSGGFARIMHPNAAATRTLVTHNRCGFMSVAEDRESEGCSSSINVGDFRDYSTYFFAALDGRTRLGQKLPANPDVDGNGVVSLREAHFYSMANAESTDIPRSTSEVYLEDWQPWYLRWLTQGPETDNIYSKLAAQVAVAHSLPPAGRPLINEIENLREKRNIELASAKKEREDMKKDTTQLQDRIRADLAERWPEALSPYTFNFYQFLQKQLGPAQDFIMHHAGYAELVRLQDRDLELETSILTVERQLAQLDKILRLRKLARLLDQFERVANKDDRAAYQRLVACEESGL